MKTRRTVLRAASHQCWQRPNVAAPNRAGGVGPNERACGIGTERHGAARQQIRSQVATAGIRIGL
ncbi:MAG: hypothetical protein DME59_01010 [Verrucomicrobia bacterium]|nr:MAG: hypothetical protein DME59_01010 [Verrucomicrobiota bacterium]PYL77133.1 MAG: hypothetical protein DMF26_04850 [Verrucomicrobiota bacterium]